VSISIARYLKDFGEPAPVPAVLSEDFDFPASDMLEFAEPAEIPVDIEAERAEAHAKGRDEASEEVRRQWDEDKAALLAVHQEELAALRASHEEELSVLLEGRLQQIAAQTAEAVSEQMAAILAPLLDEALVAKSVADLAEVLKAALLESDVTMLTVRGPAHLFEKLQTAMAMPEGKLRHVEADDLDISVDIGETALVTRMSAWAASLKKVMA
jgi:hypothetical protein